MGRSDVAVRIGAHHAVKREPLRPVHLLAGITANERMDWLVEKAAELGAASITPFVAERSVLKLKGERAEKKLAHWQAVAVSACEQCTRNRVPPLHTPADLGTGWRAVQKSAARHAAPAAVAGEGTRPLGRSWMLRPRMHPWSFSPAPRAACRLPRRPWPAPRALCPSRWGHACCARKPRPWPRWRRSRWPEAAQPVAQPREHGRGEVIALVEQLVVGAVKALRLYHGWRRAVGKGLAADRRHQPVVPRPHQQAGHAPLPRAGQHLRTALRQKPRQPRADAVMAQRIGAVGIADRRVMREIGNLQAVGNAQVGHQARQRAHEQLLDGRQTHVEGRRRQHQRIDRPDGTRHEQRSHQAAQAMAQQHQRLASGLLGTRGIDHGRKVIQQPAIGRQAAARPCRAPMAVLVVAAHRIAPGIEAPGQRLIAADVLAQAVHQQHGGARLAHVHGPVAQ
ncbi:RNA methyltransferase domain-containing protein [Ditylenchus destructor]|nr:RNA methyltransferase domain-containing protein [Ditylenchus destructor]